MPDADEYWNQEAEQDERGDTAARGGGNASLDEVMAEVNNMIDGDVDEADDAEETRGDDDAQSDDADKDGNAAMDGPRPVVYVLL